MYFTLFINENHYGVWRDYTNSSMYISKDYDPNCPMIFTINNDYHTEANIFVKVRSNPYFKNVVEYYRQARLFFESQQVKNIVMNELNKYII